MLRGTASKVTRVGRGTVFMVGLAVIVAVVLGVASTALWADGGNFILGQNNTASLLTRLTGQVPGGAALQVVNTKTEPGSRGLQVSEAENKPPIQVNATAGKATNLNADKLDGKEATDFYAAGSKVADSSHADTADQAELPLTLRTRLTPTRWTARTPPTSPQPTSARWWLAR